MEISNLSQLKNLGPVSQGWLNAVGIMTRDDLDRVGAKEAFKRVKDAGFKPSKNLLYALEGALADKHWTEVAIQTAFEKKKNNLN